MESGMKWLPINIACLQPRAQSMALKLDVVSTGSPQVVWSWGGICVVQCSLCDEMQVYSKSLKKCVELQEVELNDMECENVDE